MRLIIILLLLARTATIAVAQSNPGKEPADILAALKTEIERLKGVVPDQSHAMKDVGDHFTNLWFAAQKENWPLAEFYLAETRSHLHWAVRIIPVRKTPQGADLRLADLLDGFEKSTLKQLQESITAKNPESFRAQYQQMLANCYACHVAAGKPYLRLKIPDRPESAIIDFTPAP
jgi:cytochrome c553